MVVALRSASVIIQIMWNKISRGFVVIGLFPFVCDLDQLFRSAAVRRGISVSLFVMLLSAAMSSSTLTFFVSERNTVKETLDLQSVWLYCNSGTVRIK